MPDREERQRQQQLHQSFPAPESFSRLKIWRRETTPSTVLTLLSATVLAVLVIWATRTMVNPSSSPASIGIQQISLKKNQSQELELSSPSDRSIATSVQENNRGQADVQQSQQHEFAHVDTGTLSTGPQQQRNRSLEGKAKSASKQIAQDQKRIADLQVTPAPGSKKNSPLLVGQPQSIKMATRKEWEDHLKDLRTRGIEIVIAFDSTGSMTAAINDLKHKLQRVGTRLLELVPSARISLCTYRDHGDPYYVVKGIPLTKKVGDITRFLTPIVADGGGDFPEAVLEGLRWSWFQNQKRSRKKSRRVIIIFGDAPPHAKTQPECLKLAREIQQDGGIVSTMTVGHRPLLDFQEIAVAGGGISEVSGATFKVVRQLLILAFGPSYSLHVINDFNLD